MKKSSAFTLIEVLTVVAIIAIVAAILFPVLGAAKGRAKETSCSSQLHQLYMAADLYCQDSGGWESPPLSMVGLRTYAPKEIFRCPDENAIQPAANGMYPVDFLDVARPREWSTFPISYAYVRDYEPADQPKFWDRLREQSVVALFACQWHGSLDTGAPDASPALKYLQPRSGTILRVCFDGHAMRWNRTRRGTLIVDDLFYLPFRFETLFK